MSSSGSDPEQSSPVTVGAPGQSVTGCDLVLVPLLVVVDQKHVRVAAVDGRRHVDLGVGGGESQVLSLAEKEGVLMSLYSGRGRRFGGLKLVQDLRLVWRGGGADGGLSDVC